MLDFHHMNSGFPPDVRWLTTCPICHFEKLDAPGAWRWRCDAYHPEVIEQMERQEQEKKRQAEENERDR